MKKFILLLSFFALFSCEDKNGNGDKDADGSQMVGLWKMTDAGEYENDNCTGQIDNTGFVLLEAFGIVATMELNSGGTGSYKYVGMGEESTIPVTWNESKSEICLGGIECVEYRFNDNKFSFDDKQEGYCEDDDSGDELSQYDESNCENASDRTWYDPACSINIFTKQ